MKKTNISSAKFTTKAAINVDITMNLLQNDNCKLR
jgi:hypothetical protein